MQFIIGTGQLAVGYSGNVVCISGLTQSDGADWQRQVTDATYTALVFVSSFSTKRTGSFSMDAVADGLACLTGVDCDI